MEKKRALVAGASVAGPTVAYWLSRFGWEVTVVEQSEQLREAGQNVDVRGTGIEVLRRMGLEDDARARRTGEKGTRFIGLDGRIAATLPADRSDVDGITAELEILRGDLGRVLYEATADKDGIAYVFGERITSLTRTDDDTAVVFENGGTQTFDLVIAADGLRSSTRDAMGLDYTLTLLGIETTYMTIPKTDADSGWWEWYTAVGGRSITTRPDPYGSTRATLTEVFDVESPAARRTRAEQIAYVRSAFHDAGWQAHRVLSAMTESDDLYYEQLGQIRAERWWNDKGVLVGDAAYCASPLSGMGTTLALTGAYVLAGELSRHPRITDGLRAYQHRMEPMVARAQKLPPGGARLANPSSAFGVHVLNTVVRLIASPVFGRLSDKVFERPAHTIELPRYEDEIEPAAHEKA